MSSLKTLPIVAAITCLLFTAMGLTAQEMEMPKPAVELNKFDRLIGTYEGSGMAAMEPGGELNLPWTGSSLTRRFLVATSS